MALDAFVRAGAARLAMATPWLLVECSFAIAFSASDFRG
jgi:hypothetical protein